MEKLQLAIFCPTNDLKKHGPALSNNPPSFKVEAEAAVNIWDLLGQQDKMAGLSGMRKLF